MTKIEPIMRENLLVMARAYVAATGATYPTLSRRAHGDPPFFDRLIKAEGSISGRKYDEVMAWFEANWPAETAKPSIQPIFAALAQSETGRRARRRT